MKTKFTLLLISLFYFLAVSSTNASHLAGGEITYQWKGGNTYHIVITIYRDCNGIAAPSSLIINIASASCGYLVAVTAQPVPGTGTDINPACQGILTTCHGGSFPGFQKWEYSVDYTLPNQCSDWKFYGNLGTRSAPTTIFCLTSCNLYVEAQLDNSLFNHDSP